MVTTDTAGQLVTCVATSTGGTTTQSVTIKVDKTPPAAAITTPASGASYAQGSAVSAAYGCADALSAIATCVGTVPSGTAINTATAGPKTFMVTPTDLAGNVGAAAQVSYTITSSTSALSVTPTSVNFGTVPRYIPLVKTVTVRNTGASAVSITKVSVTQGSGTDDFSALSLCPASLAAGKSCTIFVLLFIDDRGPTLTATLNIPNNAAGSPQGVALSATIK